MPRNKLKLAIHSRNIVVIDPNTVGIQYNTKPYSTHFESIEFTEQWLLCKYFDSVWTLKKLQQQQQQSKTYKCTSHRITSHVSIACIMISLTFTKLRSLEQLLELYAQSTKKSKPNENDCKQRCFWYWRLSKAKKKRIDEVRKHENNENYDRAL